MFFFFFFFLFCFVFFFFFKKKKSIWLSWSCSVELPSQRNYIGAVMMNNDTYELVDISARGTPDKIVTEVPKGNWKVMAFYLAEGKARVVDYLILNRHGRVHLPDLSEIPRKPRRLLRQIRRAEPMLRRARHAPCRRACGRRRLTRIPENTFAHEVLPRALVRHRPANRRRAQRSVRLRGHLFATNFVKKLNDWCAGNHFLFGGHLDQEEPTNPTPLNGDFMKVWEYQAIPTIDDIWWWGRTNIAYKVLTSAAFNWDKPVAAAQNLCGLPGAQ